MNICNEVSPCMNNNCQIMSQWHLLDSYSLMTFVRFVYPYDI